MSSDGFHVDLAPFVERLRAELRDELLAELRADRDAQAWPQFMSLETAARYLDAPAERLRKLVARREIPFVQERPGGRVFFDRDDLDKWMREQRVEPRRGSQ